MEPARAASPDGGRPGISGPIGVAHVAATDRLRSELVAAVIAGAADLGHDACIVRPGDDQSHLGVLLGVGNPDSLLAIFASPRACPRTIWVGEPLLPRGELSGRHLARAARSPLVDVLRFPLRLVKDAPIPGRLARVRAAATLEHQRSRHVRAVLGLARTADRLVVTSRDGRAALLEYGLDAEAVPFGYSALTAGPMTPPEIGLRDLDFVSVGTHHARMAERRAIVRHWEGVEPRLTILNAVWGDERGELLRRSRVVLNVGRTPGVFAGVRLVLAIAAGAAVVSDPMTDPYPFVAGEHFVEAPLEGLLDAARELCGDEPRRRRMVEVGQALLAGELTMGRCLGRALGIGG